jgi:hypothetical protein
MRAGVGWTTIASFRDPPQMRMSPYAQVAPPLRISRQSIGRLLPRTTTILFACVSSFASADVYRCIEDGKTIYSDRPCQAGTASTVVVPPRIGTTAAAINPQHEANMGRIAIGQTPLQVEMVWGAPKRKNIDTRTSGRTDQWVYERPNGTTYVYFQAGIVSSISEHSDRANAAGVDSTEPPPPTRAEIEAQVRANSAGERRFLGDGMHQATILNRIGEPDSKSFSGIVECWIYNPTRLDPQTATRICFGLEGTAINIERKVAR